MKRRRRLWVVALAVGGLLAGGGLYRLARMRAASRVVDVLPSFTEPGAGPRAPGSTLFGFEVGTHRLPEVKTRLMALGWDCPDTSMRGLMQKMREEKLAEIEAVKARGGDVDSVTGASMVKRRSPKEANPQVRLTCEGISIGAVFALDPDIAKTPASPTGTSPSPAGGSGRLVLVFDSPAHPLRHVSFERSHRSDEVALALKDFSTATARLQRDLGPAHKAPPVAGDDSLPWLTPVESAWAFADVHAKVMVINWGARGIALTETLEIPWPVRADARAAPLARR